jgi:hypothetical protein
MNLLNNWCISIFLKWYLNGTHHVWIHDRETSKARAHIHNRWRVLHIGSVPMELRVSENLLLLIGTLINLSRLKTLKRKINRTDRYWVVWNLASACRNTPTNLDSYNAGGLLLMPLMMPIRITCSCCHHLWVCIIWQSILSWKPCNVHVGIMMSDNLMKMVKGSIRMSRLHLRSTHVSITFHTHCNIRFALRIGQLAELNQWRGLHMQIISGLNHITFWCHHLILIRGRGVPIMDLSATRSKWMKKFISL